MSQNDPLQNQSPENGPSREATRLFVDTGTHTDAAARQRGGLGRYAVAAIVVTVGGAAIYGMRLMGMGASLASADVAVKYDADEAVRVDQKRFETVVSRLELSGRPVQITESVTEHVFWPPVEAAPEPVVQQPRGPDPSIANRRAAEEARLAVQRRTEELERLASGIRIQAIMNGAVAVARINGSPVRVGSRVGEFTVAGIGQGNVTLECEGRTFTLYLER